MTPSDFFQNSGRAPARFCVVARERLEVVPQRCCVVPQVRRSRPHDRAQHRGGGEQAEHSPGVELLEPQQHEQDRDDDQGRQRDDVHVRERQDRNVGKKDKRKRQQAGGRASAPAAKAVDREKQQHERADDELAGLRCRILHRHPEVVGQHEGGLRPQRKRRGEREHHRARDEIAAHHPQAPVGAAETSEEDRNYQQLGKRIQAAEPLGPAHVGQRHIGPRHPEGREHEQRDRHAARRRCDLLQDIARGLGGNKRQQQQQDQDARGRARPRQRHRHSDGQTVGNASELHASDGESGRWRAHGAIVIAAAIARAGPRACCPSSSKAIAIHRSEFQFSSALVSASGWQLFFARSSTRAP